VERALGPSTKIILTTIPDTAANAALARRFAHSANVRIIARASRVRDIAKLLQAGAIRALVPEAEGAFGFAEAVLAQIGLDPAHIVALVEKQRTLITK
jgi:hypothetical protein